MLTLMVNRCACYTYGMEAIRIPSPSVLLDSPPRRATPKPVTVRDEPRQCPIMKPQPDAAVAVTRPKQSKSRNGCITCKTKRLKCDESKPTCQQCRKRNVPCGGYKKDFKWRPFEEASFTSKPTSKMKKATSPPPPFSHLPTSNSRTLRPPACSLSKPSPSSASVGTTLISTPPGTASNHSLSARKFVLDNNDSLRADPVSPSELSFTIASFDKHAISDQIRCPARNSQAPLHTTLPEQSEHESQVWGIPDFPLSNIQVEPPTQQIPSDSKQTSAPFPVHGSLDLSGLEEDDSIEEIVRQLDPETNCWPPQEAIVNQSALMATRDGVILFREPTLAPGSEEMLIMRFDHQTCGILSVKDGALENPWRTSVWPLATQSPALYHAVFAMAAFHSSKDVPSLRVTGVDYMRRSMLYMVQGMGQMSTDAALATTLSLAFAESWDQHTSTGIKHLNGAKALMRQALGDAVRQRYHGEELDRLRFLYNTWLYMDVIARLTSLDEGDRDEIDPSLFLTPMHKIHEVDPLMGCASTLFPLIGRVASLIQRVRKSDRNSFAIISEAIELKNLIERWEPPICFDPPEDPTSEVQHSLQTAQAYRWATLLYLHQAVPEIPSRSSSELARNVLVPLATVPPSSRTTIIHIYPLLAASCEADKADDRNWILKRWEEMQKRLRIGNIDRCIDVIRMVWSRRDAFETEMQCRQRRRSGGRLSSYGTTMDAIHSLPKNVERTSNPFMRLSGSWGPELLSNDNLLSTVSTNHLRRGLNFASSEDLEFEKTVRGRLHWIGVMKEWKWEGTTSETLIMLLTVC